MGYNTMIGSHCHIIKPIAPGPRSARCLHNASKATKRRNCRHGMNLKRILLKLHGPQGLLPLSVHLVLDTASSESWQRAPGPRYWCWWQTCPHVRFLFHWEGRFDSSALPRDSVFPLPSRSASTHPWRGGHLQRNMFILNSPLPSLTDVLAWKKTPSYRQQDLYNAFGASSRTQIHMTSSHTTASSPKSASSSAGQVSATLSLADLTLEAVTRLPWRNCPLLAEWW